MSDLLDLVDELTKPRVRVIYQTKGDEVVKHRIEDPPLLAQLEEAIRSSTGSGGRKSGSDRASMNMLDSDALYQFSIITSQIGDWCRIAGADTTRDSVIDLRRWYIAHEQKLNRSDEFYKSMLRQWATTIRNKLDPPKRFEVDAPCPVCGIATVVDEEGIPSRAVVVEYHGYSREVDPIKARAVCRQCETVWDSIEAIEELGEEVTETRQDEDDLTG